MVVAVRDAYQKKMEINNIGDTESLESVFKNRIVKMIPPISEEL